MNAEPHSFMMLGRKRQNRRLTIGMLIQSPATSPQLELEWQGVVDMAREQDANLVCFAGGALDSPHEFETQANVLYDLASAEQLDGVVIWTSNVGTYITPEQVKGFLGRFRPLPTVSGAYAVPGIPSVLQSNTQGMREAMIHLIKVHGCRRIAFLRGPENHFGAQERYQAFIDTLLEHHLHLNPDLISLPVDWTEGAIAMTALLDERKLLPPVDLDAIFAASDLLALAAMTTLQTRGIHVPSQVAVVGYDDSAAARIAMPALTSVVTPFYELGRQAVVLLLLNLLDNAVKFTDEGQVTLRVSESASLRESAETVRSFAHSLTRLHFEVQDTGIGILPDQLERIFEPFEQVRDVIRQTKGTGLGLAISRELVRLMGGELHVQSEPRRGSTFWFEVALPVTELTVEAAGPPEHDITGYKGPRHTVLVVTGPIWRRCWENTSGWNGSMKKRYRWDAYAERKTRRCWCRRRRKSWPFCTTWRGGAICRPSGSGRPTWSKWMSVLDPLPESCDNWPRALKIEPSWP